MDTRSKIYIAGHKGMVGSALVRLLTTQGYTNILTASRAELDLTQQSQVQDFFKKENPQYVFLVAAKVGGIMANNTYKAEFIYDNLMIAANVIHASMQYKVEKLINLGSSCIYPKFAPQPIPEHALLTGFLEPTNEPYAIAKIAAIKLCRYYNEQYRTCFLSAMPTNLYGTEDNFNVENAHVIPTMIHKFHNAKINNLDTVVLWGDGSPLREFLYVDDLAEALVLLMSSSTKEETGELVNVGYGSDIHISELAEMIKLIVGYKGTITWDTTKPNGTPKKLMDSSKIHSFGWSPKTTLKEGIEKSYQWFKGNYNNIRV